jgi:hypothetical protein
MFDLATAALAKVRAAVELSLHVGSTALCSEEVGELVRGVCVAAAK